MQVGNEIQTFFEEQAGVGRRSTSAGAPPQAGSHTIRSTHPPTCQKKMRKRNRQCDKEVKHMENSNQASCGYSCTRQQQPLQTSTNKSANIMTGTPSPQVNHNNQAQGLWLVLKDDRTKMSGANFAPAPGSKPVCFVMVSAFNVKNHWFERGSKTFINECSKNVSNPLVFEGKTLVGALSHWLRVWGLYFFCFTDVKVTCAQPASAQQSDGEAQLSPFPVFTNRWAASLGDSHAPHACGQRCMLK